MAFKQLLMIGALACGLGACKLPQLPHLPSRTAEAEVKGPPPCPCADDKAKTKVAKAPAPKVVPPTARAPAAATGPGRRTEPPQLAGAPPTPAVGAARSMSPRVGPQRVARRAAPPPAQPRRVARVAERRDYRGHDDGAARSFSGRYAVQGPYPVAERGRAVYQEQRSSYQSETFTEKYSADEGMVMRGPPGPPPGAYVDGGYAQGGYAVERRYGGPPRGYVQDRYGPPPAPCHC